VPAPADLLAAAFAAWILKNLERFSWLLPFGDERPRVHVELEWESRRRESSAPARVP
jgi:hypothetical protein